MKPRFSFSQIMEIIGKGRPDLPALVESVFAAQGYRIQMTPFGSDGSVEMVADGKVGPFGFVLPRIAVLVRSDRVLADPNVDELEAFLGCSGALQALFVSPIGFTSEARKEAGRLFLQARFWELKDVDEALEDSREGLPVEIKRALSPQ